eukprot:3022371-Rhodomonas_salina.7
MLSGLPTQVGTTPQGMDYTPAHPAPVIVPEHRTHGPRAILACSHHNTSTWPPTRQNRSLASVRWRYCKIVICQLGVTWRA